MTTRRPVVVLLREGPAGLDAAAAAMRLAGWSPPPATVSERCFVTGVVADPLEAESIMAAVAIGCGAVAAAREGSPVWGRFVRAVAELAETCRWEATTLAGLNPTQIELLAAIGRGARVPAAARVAAVSERSAHRQLIDARCRLGARTNSHAATLVRAGIDRLG